MGRGTAERRDSGSILSVLLLNTHCTIHFPMGRSMSRGFQKELKQFQSSLNASSNFKELRVWLARWLTCYNCNSFRNVCFAVSLKDSKPKAEAARMIQKDGAV